jgi:hypothetical protein
MKRARPNTQGSLDNLCGLYALVHFLRDLRDVEFKYMFGSYDNEETPGPKERSEDAFWHVLDAAQRLSMLNPDYLTRGYTAGHLVRIFNLLRDDLALDYEAVLFAELAKLGKKHSFNTVTKCVLEEARANAVVVQSNGHFFLARGFQGQSLVVDDSSGDSSRKENLTPSELANVRLSYCLAIVERSSMILKSLKEETQ